MKALRILIALAITVGFVAYQTPEPAFVHDCGLEGCEMQLTNTFCSDEEPYTDAYLMDLAHFEHPHWGYSALEEYIFEPETFNAPE